MEKENNNALQILNVKQLDEILRELEVQGRPEFRRKQDKIDRILKEVSEVATINEYLIRYKKRPIRTKPIEKTHDIKKLSERQKKREQKIELNSIKKEIRLEKKSKNSNQIRKRF